jgi:4'-phosphopantetheinyl transferase EntD
MNWTEDWSSIFNSSSFFCLKKDEEMGPTLKDLLSRLELLHKIENFHPKRRDEFLLGRLCASLAHEIHLGSELLLLPRSSDRSPLWPLGVIGSITHNQFWVGAAVSQSKILLGVGIDF